MSQSRIAVYPTSANPPTLGHADIVCRVSRQFDHVFWAAAVNPKKQYLFTQEERLAMMMEYIRHHGLENVTVETFSGATVRYAQKCEATALVKGLRNPDDFQAEYQQALGNLGIDATIETFCLFGRPEYYGVSSSMARELALLGENIGGVVLPSVAEMVVNLLRERGA